MATTMRRKRKSKSRSEDEILDQATNQLLRAIKKHVAAKDRKVTGDQLRQDGYSERFIARYERA